VAVIGFFDTLAQAQKLVTDVLLEGVIEEIIEEGQLIPQLPVTQLDGKSLTYNREVTLPTAQWVAVGDEIQSQAAATYESITSTLKRMLGQWDLDKFVINTYRNPNDLRSMAVSQARKGVLRTAEDALIYGKVADDAKAIDGLQVLVPAAHRVNQGATTVPAALSLAKLDEMIDHVKPRPDILLCNFNLFRRLNAVGRGGTTSFPLVWRQAAGEDLKMPVAQYGGIPLIRSDYITQTEGITGGSYSGKATGASTTIFALKFGAVEMGGLSLVTGNPLFELEVFPTLEDKDAERFRLKWYITLALGSTNSLACVDGITDAAIVA